MTSRFLTELDCTLVDEFGGIWKLDQALIYYSDTLGKLITAPPGFNTDFASGPSLFWVSLARDQGRRAAVIHDWLYSSQLCSRSEADAVLSEALQVEGYSASTAAIYWSMVRLFGGSHWTAPNNPQPPAVQQQIEMP